MGFNPCLDLYLYPFLSWGFHQAVRICVTIQSLEVTGGMWHKQVLVALQPHQGALSRTPNPSLPSKVRVEREQHQEPFPWHVPGQGGCSPAPMELLIGESWKIQMPGSDVSGETTRTANYCPAWLLLGLPGRWWCRSSHSVGDSGATSAENTPETLGSASLP